MEVLPPCHSAIFSGGLFFILFPSLAFALHHCANVAVSLEILSAATLWKKSLYGLGLSHLGLFSFTVFCGKSDPRFITQQNKKSKKKKKKIIYMYCVIYMLKFSKKMGLQGTGKKGVEGC